MADDTFDPSHSFQSAFVAGKAATAEGDQKDSALSGDPSQPALTPDTAVKNVDQEIEFKQAKDSLEQASLQNGHAPSKTKAVQEEGFSKDREPTISSRASATSTSDSDEIEPTFKYQRLGPALTENLLKTEAASAMTISDRFMVLGTHAGYVHVLDIEGNAVVKSFQNHAASVTCVSIDSSGEFLASAGDDGLIFIRSLFDLDSTDKRLVLAHRRSVKALALDPDYARKNSRQVLAGGMAGELIFYEKGWWGSKPYVVHQDEGPIYEIQWRRGLAAFATDKGVRIFDVNNKQVLKAFDRDETVEPRADLYRCSLFWLRDDVLLVAWAHNLKKFYIRDKSRLELSVSSPKEVQCRFSYEMEYFICGLCVFQNNFVLLCYEADVVVDELKSPRELNTTAGSNPRPQIRIIDDASAELACDILPLTGFEYYQPNDYKIIPSPTADQGFFVLSPKDIIFGVPRDNDDRVEWFLERNCFEEALVLLGNSASGSKFDKKTIGLQYLQRLFAEEMFAKAATVAARVLGNDDKLWEQWIYAFASAKQISAIEAFIPTSEPRLSSAVYEVVIITILNDNTDNFSRTLKMWPKDIIDIKIILKAVESKLSLQPNDKSLLEIAAEIYIQISCFDKALDCYLKLQKDDVLDFIKKHRLLPSLPQKVVALFDYDERYSYGKESFVLRLLVDNIHQFDISEIVQQLKPHPRYLHRYLHSVFMKDPVASKRFHHLQLDLYAAYEPARLIDFLRISTHYPLEKALKLCEGNGLIKEQIFILGRMGNTKSALDLIVHKLADVHLALEFVREQNDPDLWDKLIDMSIKDASFICSLLREAGSEVDPVEILRRIPDNLGAIAGLIPAIGIVLEDKKLLVMLRQGCRAIMLNDSLSLFGTLLRKNRKAYSLYDESICTICDEVIVGKLQNRECTLVFGCGHAYHETCLVGSPTAASRPPGDSHTTGSLTKKESSSPLCNMFCPSCFNSS